MLDIISGIDFSQALFNLVIAFLGYVGRQVLVYIKDQRAKDEAYKAGIVALLRYHSIKSAQIACKRNGISVAHRVDLQEMYKAYNELGGNGVVTEWYKRAMALPIVEDL